MKIINSKQVTEMFNMDKYSSTYCIDHSGRGWSAYPKIPVPEAAVWELSNVNRDLDDSDIDNLISELKLFIKDNGNTWNFNVDGRKLHDKAAFIINENLKSTNIPVKV